MARTKTAALDDLGNLLQDWRRHLRARNVAPSTIASYQRCGLALVEYLCAQGMPTGASAVAREHLEAFLADLQDRVAPATSAKHYRSLQQLFRWLAEDGEMPRSPMERMRPPAVPEQPVDVLTDAELTREPGLGADGRPARHRGSASSVRAALVAGRRVTGGGA